MDMIWFEKYRPKKFDDIISKDKSKIQELIKKPLEMPHFLFVSKSPGTGKTSMAKVIKNEIKCEESNFMILNSSEDRKMETIRGKVQDFARSMRGNESVPRIVLMDEADGMREDAQNALRNMMETYSSNCKFILTANNERNIIEPIKSRCSVVYFEELDKNEILKRLQFIARKEGVKYDDNGLAKIISLYYPDMRYMINEMQRLAYHGIFDANVRSPTHLEEEFYKLVKLRKVYDARKFILENGLDCESLLKYSLERTLNDEELIKKIPTAIHTAIGTNIQNNTGIILPQQDFQNKIRDIIYFTAEIAYRMRIGADKDIQMMAWILKWTEVFK